MMFIACYHWGGAPLAAVTRDMETVSIQTDSLVAFTAEQVRRLTDLSERQLRYWDKTGYFSPSYVPERSQIPYSRIYLFREVVGLRTISIVRHQHALPLQEQLKVGRWLKQHDAEPWSTLRFFVVEKRVSFKDPETRLPLRPGEPANARVSIDLEPIADDIRTRALQFRERWPEQIGKITRHRDVESNSWVLAGTRVPTKAVWNFHTAGYDLETILAAYPSLTSTDVTNAIEFEEQQRQRKHAS
jgi:uncharacterized protein (DUF433 family)